MFPACSTILTSLWPLPARVCFSSSCTCVERPKPCKSCPSPGMFCAMSWRACGHPFPSPAAPECSNPTLSLILESASANPTIRTTNCWPNSRRSPNLAIHCWSELRARVFSVPLSPAAASPPLPISESGARRPRSPPAFSKARTSFASTTFPKCCKSPASPMHCSPPPDRDAPDKPRYNLPVTGSTSKGTLHAQEFPLFHIVVSLLCGFLPFPPPPPRRDRLPPPHASHPRRRRLLYDRSLFLRASRCQNHPPGDGRIASRRKSPQTD